jgi:hypothetical protein
MGTRYVCKLTREEEPECSQAARVTVVDAEGTSARGCPRHAVAALGALAAGHVDWQDSNGLNEFERQALELTEERSKLASNPITGGDQ